jgi:predicted DNA-binding transcriptional regulator YafY
MLLLLQTRGRMTAAALAEELEVSVRTVYRDLNALSAAGVPVYTEPGPHGGCQLVDGYRTRLTGLTQPEAEALFLAGVSGPMAELGLGTVLAAAQLKVLAALPPELRSRATRVRERFHLDTPGWFQTGDDIPHLPEIAAAVWDERKVEVDYDRAGAVAQRVLDPLGLVLKAGTWYLVARTNSQVRTYRVSRLRGVTVREERFERPDDFDLATHWQESSLAFEDSLLRERIVARVSPDALAALPYALEPAAARAAHDSAGPPDADGWVRIVIPTESLDYAEGAVLSLGAGAEVLEPRELRTRLASTARHLTSVYGGRRRG